MSVVVICMVNSGADVATSAPDGKRIYCMLSSFEQFHQPPASA